MKEPSEKSQDKVQRLVDSYTDKSGTTTHPDPETTEAVKQGLAMNMDQLGRPLCPCRFYPDKTEEIKNRTWICPCADMQIYKYCHCLLFVTEEGLPITEHLPEDHEGRQIYGLVKDPTPEQGRPLRDKAAEREEERKNRPS
jgi:ferredoxin-thioredoxin reductase catalytic chain